MADEHPDDGCIACQGKALIQSKIFWTNIVAILIFVVGTIFGPIDEETQVLILGAAIPVLNIVLRYFSKNSIKGLI
jgi:hypothetical protein